MNSLGRTSTDDKACWVTIGSKWNRATIFVEPIDSADDSSPHFRNPSDRNAEPSKLSKMESSEYYGHQGLGNEFTSRHGTKESEIEVLKHNLGKIEREVTTLKQSYSEDMEQLRKMFQVLEKNVQVAFDEHNKQLDKRFHSYDGSIETLDRNQKVLKSKLDDMDKKYNCRLVDLNQLIGKVQHEAIDRNSTIMEMVQNMKL